MGLTRAEQETILRWDEDEKIVYVYSASPVTWRKMARLGVHPTKQTTFQGNPSGKFYRVPFSGFRWGLKRQVVVGGAPRGFARRNPAPDGVSRAHTQADGQGGGA